MGFKGQFITVLPTDHAVVVMTSLLPTDGGLRDATYLNLYRHMINDYIIPAMNPTQKPVATAVRIKALRDELADSRYGICIRAASVGGHLPTDGTETTAMP